MKRYAVGPVNESRSFGHVRYGIWDRKLHWYCALPDSAGNMIPLEWRTPAGAEAWLLRCHAAWYTGEIPAPAGWRG